MIDGKAEGYGNFIMRSRRNNQFGWVSLSYRMIYDPDGVPIKAVGIQEKMSDLSGVHSFSFPRRPLPEVIRHDLIVKLRVNLTTTTIDELWAGGLHRTNLNVLFYPKLIRKWSSFLFYKAEGREFRQTFQRDNLLNAFEQGKKWFSKEYRWVDQGGNIRWMMYTVNLVRNAYTRDIEMFSCFVDVQKLSLIHIYDIIAQFKKELKISSPSKVFASIGGFSAAGYGEGFIRQMKDLKSNLVASVPMQSIARAGGVTTNNHQSSSNSIKTVNQTFNQYNSCLLYTSTATLSDESTIPITVTASEGA